MSSEVLDDFEDLSDWMPVVSGLAELRLTPERGQRGSAMRLDFDFKGGGGFVVARKPLRRPMPESYVICFAIRGMAPPNRFELKLVDPSGRNVWWRHWDAFDVPAEWRTIRVPSREIEFAWGPAGGGGLAELGAIELGIAAGPGGAGTVSIGELQLEDRTYTATPLVRASSVQPGFAPACALDNDPHTSWLSAPSTGPHWLEIDFRQEREYGGLVVDWHPDAAPARYRIETSADGTAWTTAHTAEATGVERSYVYLPAAVSRFLRLVLDAATSAGCGIAELVVQPFEFSRSINSFFEHVARSEPRGLHPRWLAGQQSYWTPIGVADGRTSAIMNEEGMVEVDRGTWSLEPFVHVDGRFFTWADADITLTLEDDWIPVPASVWRCGRVTLQTTAFAERHDGDPILYLRYRIANTSERPLEGRLFVAIRPFQVNPPWQQFGALGGMRRVGTLQWDGSSVCIDGDRIVVPLTRPVGFGAAPFELGEIPTYLARGELPARTAVRDAFGYASGALAFDVALEAGAVQDVYLAAPFGSAEAEGAARLAGTDGATAFDTVVRGWHERLAPLRLALPGPAAVHAHALRTAAAQVLVNRDGPALQPGPRRYTRSWIRDGAIMAAALLRVGRHAEAGEFVRWYATYQAPDGNVPCCVDRNGPDWLVEHDSHGELIFAVMEYFRFTRDRAFLAEQWPAVQRAVAYLESLRATRLGPDFERPELRARRGLLPESASHEGYLAHPVHSYWDDFWALQGYRDAAGMAAILGEAAEARRIATIGKVFEAAVRDSVACTIADRGIDYVPGSVEWADFDPTATANAIALLGAADDLPPTALHRTFDEYLEGFRRRRRGDIDWNNYSAYEVRIVGALVQLGRRDDAAELLAFLMSDRRPPAWNQWPEISWRDPRSPGHLGDVPHTWIGAEYILAVRSMLAYERAADRSLVLAAGVPASWLAAGSITVGGLPTHYGTLDLHLQRDGADGIQVSVAGTLTVPPGGIVLRPPLARPLASVTVNGRAVRTFDGAAATIDECPAQVALRS